MKLKIRMLGMVLILSLLMGAFYPITVKADTYGQTLEFGNQYNFTNEEGRYKYDLVLEKSGKVTFNFIASNSEERSAIYIYSGNETVSFPGYGTYRDFYGSYQESIDLKAGTYQIIFCGGSWNDHAPATGTLVVKFTDCKETFPENELVTNNEYGVASEIGVVNGKTINGQLAANDEVDFYSFEVPKNKTLTVTYVSAVKLSRIHIFKSTLDLEYWERDIKAGSHKYTYTLPAGKYFMSIANADTRVGTGNYTLKLSTDNLPQVKLKSVVSKARKAITVKYNELVVDSYQIQIATNKSFTKNKKTISAKDTTKVVKGLSTGKTYYVRVRTVTTASSGLKLYKIYSPWSNIKNVKVK